MTTAHDSMTSPKSATGLSQKYRKRPKGWLRRRYSDMWRKLVFFTGDLRRLATFPWVTWAATHHRVRFEEILEALPLIQYGDIGIHRDEGYLSNVAIPGFMKHAWIHTLDGIESPAIVEAVSEGVVKRSPVYPIYSDYTIVLAPKGVNEEERKGACVKANSIVGAKYDVHFEFDIEHELHFYTGRNKGDAQEHLLEGTELMRDYDHGFSCTEVVSYCWWHKREQLQIFRTKSRGKSVILADSFLNNDWTIRWASESVTVDAAHKMGLHEQGLSLIESYRR